MGKIGLKYAHLHPPLSLYQNEIMRTAEILLATEAGRLFNPPISAAMIRYLECTGRLKARRTERGVRVFERAEVERVAAERAARKAAARERAARKQR